MPSKYAKSYRLKEGTEYLKFGFGPSPVDPPVDVWYKPQKLNSVEKNEKVLVLHFDIAGEDYGFPVTAPEIGGFHISSDIPGFFQPENLAAIKYDADTDSNLRLTANDNTSLVIIENKNGWSLAIYDADKNKRLYFTPESVSFGFYEGKPQKIKLRLDISNEKVISGFGERFNGLNQLGARHAYWNNDCGYHGDSDGLELWRSYKNVPLLHGNGYSLFFNTYYPGLGDVGYSNENEAVFDFWGPTFDIYIWTGNIRKTLVQYTDLTGKSFLPPKWACHYMSGGGNGFWYGPDWGQGNIPEKYLGILRDVVSGYEKLGTPNVAALYGEGWIAYNLDAYKILEPYGTRMLSWNPPDYNIDDMRSFLPGVDDKDLPRIKDVHNPEKDAGNYIDFFNPHVKTMLKNRYKKYYEVGLRGGMLDFAEMVPEIALYCNGMTGREMHNFNPYWYGKLYGEAAKELVGDDYLYYCRGGCAGSQKWCANFSGDQASKFFGLKQQLSSALSMGVSGFSAWGADLAGYEMKPTDEVFMRGLQFSTFQPLMRAHGTRTRCPWDYSEEAQEVYKSHYWLRENIVNEIYSSFISSNKSGLPLMQAMVLAYPEQKDIADIDTQYLFCNDFLVAPVMEEAAKLKKVAFPEGKWYDLWTGKCTDGGQTIDVTVNIETSPVYVKSGAVIPLMLGDENRLCHSMLNQDMHEALLITPPEKDSSTVVWLNRSDNIKYQSVCGENLFEIRNDGVSEASVILIYGIGGAKVLVDGDLAEVLYIEPDITAVSTGKTGWHTIIVTK